MKESQLITVNAENLKIESDLTLTEQQILMTVLFNRKKALSWHFSHIERLWSEMILSQQIRTVLHKTWQISDFQVLQALENELIWMLCERLDCEILKSCQSSYQNSWFLVWKSQKKKYRLINAVMHINKIIIHNVMIFSNIKQFMKEFSELKTVSLVDIQFSYDQITLKKKSCDLTEFMMILELLWNCTLIQSRTNSVAQFCRAMIQILKDLIFTVCCMFLDNIAVKEP